MYCDVYKSISLTLKSIEKTEGETPSVNKNLEKKEKTTAPSNGWGKKKVIPRNDWNTLP